MQVAIVVLVEVEVELLDELVELEVEVELVEVLDEVEVELVLLELLLDVEVVLLLDVEVVVGRQIMAEHALLVQSALTLQP